MIEALILLGICVILAGFLWFASRPGKRIQDTRRLQVGDIIRLHVVAGERHVTIQDVVTAAGTDGFFLGDKTAKRHPWQDISHKTMDAASAAGTRWVEKL